MLTILVLFCILLVIAFIAAFAWGVVAVLPGVLLILLLLALDVFFVKLIFGKKNKK